MKKKLFFFSDSHGHYDETIKCLEESGYDENNKEHLLVCLGDFTDRGTQSLELMQWLYRLDKEGKAIVLGGNHTKFLIDYLSGSSVNSFNYMYNGVKETFASLLERTLPFESWCIIDKKTEDISDTNFVLWLDEVIPEINEKYPWLLLWLKSLPKYFESKNYIGVHGAIDTTAKDWRKPLCKYYDLVGWDALDFDNGNFLGKAMDNVDGKTVVAGHFHTYNLRYKYEYSKVSNPDSPYADHSILGRNTKDGGHKIFIDGCTVRTKKINVLVVEDELLEDSN